MNVAKIIDQTYLKKEAKENEVRRIAEETKRYGFRGFCVFPEHIKIAKEVLKERGIKVTALIDPPTGASSSPERVKMVKLAKEAGADEVDLVMKIDAFKNKQYQEVLEDLKEISKILPIKVIIGSGYLTDQEVKKASEIVKKSGAISVKTSTIDDPLDHSELKEKAKHLRIMKTSAPGLLIKAAGNIRTMADLKMMVKAGADIIGTSSGIEIVNESLRKKEIKSQSRGKGEIIE